MAAKRKRTTDAVEILQRRYYEGKPRRIAALEQQRADDEIARQIYELREKAGLTQKRLAELVGTTPSVICRLEDSDYEGHSLTMLKRRTNLKQREGLWGAKTSSAHWSIDSQELACNLT